MAVSKLKPSPASQEPELKVKLLSSASVHSTKYFDFVSETVNNRQESIAINFNGRDLKDYIEFIGNKVLVIDDISSSFTGVTTSSFGDSVVGLTTFSLSNFLNPLLSVNVGESSFISDIGDQLLINYQNHDFSTGEPLDYSYTSSPIEISPTVVGTSLTTILPSKVYAIKVSDSRFKISTTEQNALSGIAVTFAGVGISTSTHEFNSANATGRSIIQIDNIIQLPLYYKGVNVGVTSSVGINTTIISVSGISSIFVTDFISVNDEIMRISSIGTTSLQVVRGEMGTVASAHTTGDNFKLLKGNYNIKNGNIYFSSPPFESSNFSGRIFYKKRYDKNIIFDDISNQFVGTARTFNLLSNGSSIGITTSNITGYPYGMLLINNVFQPPITGYTLASNSGISTLTFTGDTESELPKSGKILKFDYNVGSGYQPHVSAAATVSVGAGGTITSVYLTGNGSGYLTSPDVKIISSVGSGASITALVGTGNSVGFITGFTITNPGSGYTTSPLPVVQVGHPYGYTNLPLVYLSGSGNGQGAKIDLKVGAGGSMIYTDLNEIGYSYSIGDVLTVSGLGTQTGYSPFTLTVTDVYTDSFAFWTFGKLTKASLTPNIADGNTRIFELKNYETDELIDFELENLDTRLNIKNNFLVFVNNILQSPSNFELFGPYIIFYDIIPANSRLDILIYTASNDDSKTRIIEQTVKVGDTLEIQRDSNNLGQESRFVNKIPSKSQVKTPTYTSVGINSDFTYLRPVNWTKQTLDVVVAGENIYKSRDMYKSLIRPKASVIVGVSTTSNVIYVDDLNLFDVDNIQESDLQIEIFEDIDLKQAKATATVSSASTVSLITVTDGGSGYSQLNPPEVIISSKEISKNFVGKTWNQINVSNTTIFNKLLYADDKLVSVGNSQSLRYTTNTVSHTNVSVGVGSTNLFSVAYGSNKWMVGGDNGFISISNNPIFTSWSPIGLSTISYTSVPPTVQDISFTGRINDIVYNSDTNLFVGVASSGTIFTYSSSGAFSNKCIKRESGTQNDLNSIIVDRIYDVGENSYKTQYVSVGNSATILVSASTINNSSVGSPGITWNVAMSESVSPTGISGEQLNDIVHTGINTLPFIVVGNNGLILTFPNNRLNGGSFYNVTPPTSENLTSIAYDSETETAIAVGNSGSVFTSQRYSRFRDWTQRTSGISSNISDIAKFVPTNKYVAIAGNITILSKPEVVGASATALVSSSGIVTSIIVTEGGQFYSSTPKVTIDTPDLSKERIKSCKILGDYGTLTGVTTSSVGIGTTSPALVFNLKVDPSLVTSGISTGDYYVLYSTNVGNGVTSILTTGEVVGVTTQYIDCVFRADDVKNDLVSGIVTVTSNVSSINGINTSGSPIYGRYSWGKFYDFDTRTEPLSFPAYTLNGSAGLSTSPKVLRLTSIGVTFVPDQA